MTEETEEITDLGLMSNKQLKELSEQCEIAYKAAQRVVSEQCDIMERSAALYEEVQSILQRRQGKGRKKKETTPKTNGNNS